MAIVKKQFTLTLEDHTQKTFVVGESVEGELAEHWYVAAHCQDNAGEQSPVASDAAEVVSEETAQDGEAEATAAKGKKK